MITLRNIVFFSDFQYGFRSSYTADLLAELVEYLVELQGLLIGLELLELEHLIYPSLSTFFWVWHSVLLHKLKSYEIIGLVFGLDLSFLSNRLLWVGSLSTNIQLMLELLKAPFLILHFSFCTLMFIMMMLSVRLSSLLMTLLSILAVWK